MADFTITITDSIKFFGGEPPNLWGTMVWGTDGWAYGQPEVQRVDHLMDMGSVVLSEDLVYSGSNTFSDSVVLTGALVELTLRDAAGYYHVFLGDVTDSEERASTTWSSAASPSSSWSQVTKPTTTWSDA